MGELELTILAKLRERVNGSGKAGWLRFVAYEEARRQGGSAADAEQALEALHAQGLLCLAFGYERGTLSAKGLRTLRAQLQNLH